jgi:acyl-CoA thioesterase II
MAARDLSEPGDAPADIEAVIAVEALGSDVFRGTRLWRPANGRAVFGGQVLAQALTAACRTVPAARPVHSLHGYFLLAGDERQPILYEVQRLRDGGSMSTRLCIAKQSPGRVIFVALVSFHDPHARVEAPLRHQWRPPRVPPPEALPSQDERARAILGDPRVPASVRPRLERLLLSRGPFDLRLADAQDPLDPAPAPAYRRVWMRARGRVRDAPDPAAAASDTHWPGMHACAAAYASDFNLLGAALLPFGLPQPAMSLMASVDHAVWFHAPFRADEWVLYEIESPRFEAGRGFSVGRVFTRDGRLVMSTAQEGLVRFHPLLADVPHALRTVPPPTSSRAPRAGTGADADADAPAIRSTDADAPTDETRAGFLRLVAAALSAASDDGPGADSVPAPAAASAPRGVPSKL